MRIQVLGPVRGWQDAAEIDLGTTGQRTVLGLLVLAEGQPMSIAELVDAMWPQRPPSTATNVVQTHVSRLRRILEPDRSPRTPSLVLPWTSGGYALHLAADQVDLAQFRRLIASARQSRAAGDLRATADLLGQALRLWQGMPLAGTAAPASHPKVVALAGERDAALAHYAEATIAAGLAGEALPYLSAAAAAQPLDEAAQARLIHGYHSVGQRAAAFAHYATTRRQLADQLGVEPGPELQAAHAALLQPPGPAPAAAGTDPPRPRTPPATPLAVPAQLPRDLPGFIGRESELAALDAVLRSPSAGGRAATPIVVITGMAGVGKTVLALHWAHRVAERFPDGQLYFNLGGYGPPEQSMSPEWAVRGVLDAIGVPVRGRPAGLAGQAALLRSELAGRRVLLVLDNVGDAASVRPLLPGGPGCLVVVTSRSPLTGLVATEQARPVTVDLFTPAEVRALLATRLGSDRVASEPTAVDRIGAQCAYLPLALAIAAAKAATQPHRSLTQLATELDDTATRLDELTTGDPEYEIHTAFSWSYQSISRPAARMFRLLGLSCRPDISLAAAASLAALPVPQARHLLAELASARLLSEGPPGRYAMHDLLRAYSEGLAGRIDPDEPDAAAVQRLLDYYLQAAYAADRLLYPARAALGRPPADPAPTTPRSADPEQALGWLRAEHPVLLAATALAARMSLNDHAWQLAWSLNTYLDRQGHWSDLLAACTLGLDAARHSTPDVQAGACRRLATAYARLGRDDEAQAHLEEALALYAAIDDNAGQAHVHANLGKVWELRGVPEKAMHHAQLAQTLFAAAGDRRGQAMALNATGWYSALLGRPADTIALCRTALQLFQRLGDRHGEAPTWDSLGYAYSLLGQHTDAAECFHQAIALYRNLGERFCEADALNHLGDASRAMADIHQAKTAWRAAAEILTELNHPTAADVQAKLAL
jgi:DNA-binding SARP family transcriptional activator/tetratricopeptide (TPR) repeat protein